MTHPFCGRDEGKKRPQQGIMAISTARIEHLARCVANKPPGSVEAVPDRAGEDAAACAVVEPGEHDRAAGEAEDEADVPDWSEIAVGSDGEEVGQVPDGPDRGDEQRGGESAVAALQQRQREAAPARLLAEGDQDHDHGDRNDADRGQAAVAAEVAPARQLADGRSNCERNSEESERAQRRGPPAQWHAPAGHPGEKVANARTTPDDRRHRECCEGRAEKRGKIRRPTDTLFNHVPRGRERERPPPRDRIRQDHEGRKRPKRLRAGHWMKRTSRRDGRDGTRHASRGPAAYAQAPFATSTIAVTSRVMAAIGSSSVTGQ